jgi:predicted ATPase
MIYLKSIDIQDFKGIRKLHCDFDDLTVIAGPNNSGKSSLLLAVHLMISSINGIKAGKAAVRENAPTRISLNEAIQDLGGEDRGSLLHFGRVEAPCRLVGSFEGGVSVTITSTTAQEFDAQLSVDGESVTQDLLRDRIEALKPIRSHLMFTVEQVPRREQFINFQQLEEQVAHGRLFQNWRASFFWALQNLKIDAFDRVRSTLANFFPDIALEVPPLSRGNSFELNYREGGLQHLDISFSGSGLRTFLGLVQSLRLIEAEVLLFDEPDAHLHASKQASALDLLIDAGQSGRQVIIATHAPELIARCPVESLRWIERGAERAEGGKEAADLLDRLGATPDMYLPLARHPDVIVYVEGKDDKPVIEGLIRWCRRNHPDPDSLPTTLVVRHRDGRFDAQALQGIVRYSRELKVSSRIIGVRDLDWHYQSLPPGEPQLRTGDGFQLLTLPCKELENLFCDAGLLHEVYEEMVPVSELTKILEEESATKELVDDWRYQVLPRIRNALSDSYDPSTREREGEATFCRWRDTPQDRIRLVAGKKLIRLVRARVKRDFGQQCYESRMLDRVKTLSRGWAFVAAAIFPGAGWDP